ncbi:MAG: hypothetical protein AMXMBFR84_29330 [Candidatus Hydrogenedentota bacterium]
MAITLGNVTFDHAHTAALESHDEVGGRDGRRIRISGLILGQPSLTAIHEQLDAILDAASADEYNAALSLRPGRRMWVRREEFERAVANDALVGSFQLVLEAKDPHEESVAEIALNWTIDASGDTLSVTAMGNVFSEPRITLTAVGDLVNPALSDGTRQIAYSGTALAGSVLVFDGPAKSVRLNGDDVTPYATGEFPTIAPEGTVLTFFDDTASAHQAQAVVAFRDRWW